MIALDIAVQNNILWETKSSDFKSAVWRNSILAQEKYITINVTCAKKKPLLSLYLSFIWLDPVLRKIR